MVAVGTQHSAHHGERLVVELERVAVHAMLDAHALLPMFPVTHHIPSEALGHVAAERNWLSQIAHRVRTGESRHAVVDQPPVLQLVLIRDDSVLKTAELIAHRGKQRPGKLPLRLLDQLKLGRNRRRY